jgi:hypothetical protein
VLQTTVDMRMNQAPLIRIAVLIAAHLVDRVLITVGHVHRWVIVLRVDRDPMAWAQGQAQAQAQGQRVGVKGQLALVHAQPIQVQDPVVVMAQLVEVQVQGDRRVAMGEEAAATIGIGQVAGVVAGMSLRCPKRRRRLRPCLLGKTARLRRQHLLLRHLIRLWRRALRNQPQLRNRKTARRG